MREYSERSIPDSVGIGKYLVERSKEGWDVFHLQRGYGEHLSPYWYIILSRDSEGG